jgi:hypothetical protein
MAWILVVKKTYYEKRGRRYVPVAEYDNDWMDSFPEGTHLIVCRPGVVSRRYRIEPALAPMIAAGVYAEDAIINAIHDAQKLRPDSKVALTPEQQELMAELTDSMNQSDAVWLRPSSRDAAEAAVRAIQAEAERRMSHPAVRQAYEHFLTVARLCEDTKEKQR